MVGGSLLHGLPLVGLPNIYYIYIYIYIYINQKMGLGPWGRWAVGFDIITYKIIIFYFIFIYF